MDKQEHDSLYSVEELEKLLNDFIFDMREIMGDTLPYDGYYMPLKEIKQWAKNRGGR